MTQNAVWTGGLGGCGRLVTPEPVRRGVDREIIDAPDIARRVEAAVSIEAAREVYRVAGCPAIADMWPDASMEDQCTALDMLRPWRVYRDDYLLEACTSEAEAQMLAADWQDSHPGDWIYRVEKLPDEREGR